METRSLKLIQVQHELVDAILKGAKGYWLDSPQDREKFKQWLSTNAGRYCIDLPKALALVDAYRTWCTEDEMDMIEFVSTLAQLTDTTPESLAEYAQVKFDILESIRIRVQRESVYYQGGLVKVSFVVVVNPTSQSGLVDVVFATTPNGLHVQFNSGLQMGEIAGFYPIDELDEALQHGLKLLADR